MKYIKVWCECNINGSFGGDRNEDVFLVSDDCSEEDIDNKILDKFSWLVQELEYEGYEEVNLIKDGILAWGYLVVCKL
jgi:hypothetical protein